MYGVRFGRCNNIDFISCMVFESREIGYLVMGAPVTRRLRTEGVEFVIDGQSHSPGLSDVAYNSGRRTANLNAADPDIIQHQ